MKKKTGRPPTSIDLTQLEGLASIQCTYEELAAFFKCDKRTIIRYMKKPEYREAFERGMANGRVSLRRAQFQAALKGDKTMQIWLGKQYLGQKDSVTTVHEGGLSIDTDAKQRLLRQFDRIAASAGAAESNQRVN